MILKTYLTTILILFDLVIFSRYMLVNTLFTGLIFQTEIEPEEKFFQGGLEKFWKQVGFLSSKFFPLRKVKKYNDLYNNCFYFYFLFFSLCHYNVKQLLKYYNDINHVSSN